MVLDGLGHLTRVALDSREALAAALDFKPDFAFLDIGMPYLNGLDLARKLRETTDLKHICITALSGWGTENDVKKSSNAGMDYHLTKPVDLNDVVDLLSKVAQRRDSEKLPSNSSNSYTHSPATRLKRSVDFFSLPSPKRGSGCFVVDCRNWVMRFEHSSHGHPG